MAACNPCPCGWTGDPQRSCVCGEGRRRRYWARLSGPLLDRIDLQVAVRRAEARELAQLYRPDGGGGAGALRAEAGDPGGPQIGSNPAEASTAEVAARVLQARERMRRRNPDGCINADLPTGQLALVLELEDGALALWERALAGRRLTARGGERLLRVARSICDLEGRRRVNAAAVAEAIAFRSFDLVAEPMEAGAAGPERDGSRAAGRT